MQSLLCVCGLVYVTLFVSIINMCVLDVYVYMCVCV